MPELKETLDAIDQELAGLLKADEPLKMTLDEVLSYAREQIGLAKADSDPAPRLAALREVINLAKAYGWEENNTMSVAVYSGDCAVQRMSAHAERNAEHPGQGLGVPGPEASPASGAFESASGPTGPASNTASPAARYMPPAFPQSEPAASAEGFMAKAADVLKSVDGGEALLDELKGMLNTEAKAGDGEGFTKEIKDDGWPLDLSTPSFLEGEPEVKSDEDFGVDPSSK